MFSHKGKFVMIIVLSFAVTGGIVAKNKLNSPLNHPEFAIEDCESFKNNEDREDCREKFVFDKIFQDADLSHCLLLEEEKQNSCRLKGAIHSIKKGASITLCDQLDETVQEDCRYNTIMELVLYSKDNSLCENLTRDSSKRSCMTRFKESNKQKATYNSLTSRLQGFLRDNNLQSEPGVKSSTISTDELDESLIHTQDNISLYAIKHLPRSNNGSKPFTTKEGTEIGIDVNTHTSLDFKIPFDQGKGVASGDFDNDGWPDLVFGSKYGPKIYKNTGKSTFQAIDISHPQINTFETFLVSFVDINNDGWLDLYFSTYGEGQYLLINDKNGFTDAKLEKLPIDTRPVTMSATFGDIDHDGDLEIYQGYLSHIRHPNRQNKEAINHLLVNNGGTFSAEELDQEPGETLTTLFTDINDDGFLDLLVGNDFEGPDSIYIGKQEGFRAIDSLDDYIPLTTFNNMGYDTGDINNDLILDIFSVDLGDIGSYTQEQVNVDYCTAINNREEREHCNLVLSVYDIIEHRQTEECLSVFDQETRDHCLLAILIELAEETRDSFLCERIPEHYASQKSYCNYVSLRPTEDYFLPFPNHLDQESRNVLLIGGSEGDFRESAIKFGVDQSHWSWNAKFADLDNDSWQDIYIGNGYEFDLHKYTSNVFFHNQQGLSFEVAQESFGLTNYLHTSSYTLLDLDNDGDLDIVSSSINAPAVVSINNESIHNTLTIDIRDKRGNSFGIGTKVTIYYEGGQQMREIKSGGGYLSFDAPTIHFGLNDIENVNKLMVQWSTGEETIVEANLSTNQKILIIRE
jgi:hypothetical protein